MPILVKLSTTLRDYIPNYQSKLGIEVPFTGALTAQALAESLALPLDEIHVVMINGKHAEMDAIVQDGDRVAYFPAVGGG